MALEKHSGFEATDDIDMASHAITSVVSPSNADDAATKGYVDVNTVNAFGDGHDGAFNSAGAGNFTQGAMYQYTAFTLNTGHTYSATTVSNRDPVVILVQGDVAINGTIDFDGDGYTGGAGGAAGTASEENGYEGSVCAAFSNNDGISPTLADGGNGGVGAHAYCGSGGGGGGSGASDDTDGLAGGNGGNASAGAGGTGGTAGTTPKDETPTISAFQRRLIKVSLGNYAGMGGAGGGGGASADDVAGDGGPGGAGGAGGGSLIIIANGDVTIGATGVITCDGVNGTNGTDAPDNTGGDNDDAGGGGGGGAGGAGGSITIYYTGSYTNSGSVAATGGTGGTGGDGADGAGGGNGGAGGAGGAANTAGTNGTAGGTGGGGGGAGGAGGRSGTVTTQKIIVSSDMPRWI